MVITGLLAAAFAGLPASTDDALLPIDRLKAGNRRFIDGRPIHPNQGRDRMVEVAKGQHPYAVVLTCADSRLSPEIIFDQGLGDLFVVRVAGNVADPYVLASVEYAVEHLGSGLVVILGHEKCGAVKAAMDASAAPKAGHGHGTKDGHKPTAAHGSAKHEGHIFDLVAEILPAVAAAKSKPGDFFKNAVEANVARTVSKTVAGAPLAELVASGRLTVIGAVYDVSTGLVRTVSASRPKDGKAFVKVHRD
ncbi:MAG: carbonic anhydrase [Armatimonadetes bacterium]|nr:carbonic anhydrase [Armatimonadota bacterium]